MDVVVTESEAGALGWARQFVAADPSGRSLVEVPSRGDAERVRAGAIAAFETAARRAGRGGRVIASVGHGGVATTDEGFVGDVREGMADLAPRRALRVRREHVFYGDDRAESDRTFIDEADAAGPGLCRRLLRARPGSLEAHEEGLRIACTGADDARERVAVREAYLRIGRALRSAGVAEAVLLTCRVGGATLFIDRIGADWGVTVVAYTRRVASVRDAGGRWRFYLEGDAPGRGTNTDRARTELPGADMARSGARRPRPPGTSAPDLRPAR